LRSVMPTVSMSKVGILQQWVRLHRSYSRGLFEYYKFPVEVRTNSQMEQHLGEEKMKNIKRCGQPQNWAKIRIRGEFELKQQYAGKKEIVDLINGLERTYCKKDVRSVLESLIKEKRMKISTFYIERKKSSIYLSIHLFNTIS